MRDAAIDGSRISDCGATSQAAGGAKGESAQALRGRQSLAPGQGRLSGPWVAAGRLGVYSRRVPVRPTRPFAASQLVDPCTAIVLLDRPLDRVVVGWGESRRHSHRPPRPGCGVNLAIGEALEADSEPHWSAAQPLLDLFQRNAPCLRHHLEHPDQLQHHHA